MLYSLSTSVIMDTIQATAAFQTLSAPDDRKALLSPLLQPQVRGQLKIMVRNAFAETILAILPYVEECSLDGETSASDPGHQDPSDESDLLLTVELSPLATGQDVSGASLRRVLEHIVVMKSMRLWTLAAGDHETSGTYGALAASAMTTLLSSLRPQPRPFLRNA